MNLCETCEYWKPCEEWTTGYGMNMGRCSNIPMFFDATRWSEDGEGREFKDEFSANKAFAQDGSDYKAYVLTLPAFGCVQHSKNE